MIYRASLTSELSIRRSVKPFDNPDEFVKSDYGLVYSKHDHNYIAYLKSKEGWHDEGRVMDKPLSTTEARKVLLNSKAKIMMPHFLESLTPDFACNVSVPWSTRYPNYNTFGFPKKSEYYETFNRALIGYQESGLLKVIKARYRPRKVTCPNDEGDMTLGGAKVIALFAIFGIGCVLAFILFISEVIFDSNNRGKV